MKDKDPKLKHYKTDEQSGFDLRFLLLNADYVYRKAYALDKNDTVDRESLFKIRVSTEGILKHLNSIQEWLDKQTEEVNAQS